MESFTISTLQERHSNKLANMIQEKYWSWHKAGRGSYNARGSRYSNGSRNTSRLLLRSCELIGRQADKGDNMLLRVQPRCIIHGCRQFCLSCWDVRKYVQHNKGSIQELQSLLTGPTSRRLGNLWPIKSHGYISDTWTHEEWIRTEAKTVFKSLVRHFWNREAMDAEQNPKWWKWWKQWKRWKVKMRRRSCNKKGC